jgi:hypothetical protein
MPGLGVLSHKIPMPRSAPAPNLSVIAERLRAHARLCEQIASECWNESTAEKLRAMARECADAAAEIMPQTNAEPSIRH